MFGERHGAPPITPDTRDIGVRCRDGAGMPGIAGGQFLTLSGLLGQREIALGLVHPPRQDQRPTDAGTQVNLAANDPIRQRLVPVQ